MSNNNLQLYGWYLSQATYRIRVALNLKGLKYTEIPIDLHSNEQYSNQSFLKTNPLGAVPALVVENGQESLTQSLAILEYLEETHPTPPLLPPISDPIGRAHIRSLASIIISDAHPLITHRVQKYLDMSESEWRDWNTHWFHTTLRNFEKCLKASGKSGRFCYGDDVTIADICLTGWVQTQKALGIEKVEGIEIVDGIVERCEGIEEFWRARAEGQGDWPEEKG